MFTIVPTSMISGPCLWALVVFVSLVAQSSLASAGNVDLQPERYKPQWNVGQRWIVASTSLQTQARSDPKLSPPPKTVRWQFEVQSIEKIDERECFKMEVKPVAGESGSTTTLWVDRQSMTLRRVQTQLPVAGGIRTVVENYRSSSGQPFPAFAPLTVPPLELPLFLTGTKGKQTFSYATSSSGEGEKAVGDIDFAFSLEQEVTQPPADKIKGLLPVDYSKSLVQKPVIEVRIKAASFKVRQLWQPGLPWPVYSNNGVAESRLVEEEPGDHPRPKDSKPE